jgi:hypothetical protein
MMRTSFDADASKVYRQPNEAVLLFLIIGGERILVHDHNGSERTRDVNRAH